MADIEKKKVNKKKAANKTLISGKKNRSSAKKNFTPAVKKNSGVKKVAAAKKPGSARDKHHDKVDLPVINKTDIAEITENDIIDPSAIERGDEPMTIIDHLNELRTRIIYIIASFFIFACAAFFLSDWLLLIINRPFLETGNKLNIFTMAGGFIIRMKLAAAASLLLTIPLIFFHIWRFISPAIDRPERFFSRMTLAVSVTLFYAGLTLVFFAMPSVVKVLLGFINPGMISTIDASDYLHFLFFMSLVMGIVFELPVVALVLTRIGIITPQFLIRKRKYAIIIIWITAALATPGADILSQSLLGIPLMLLYEVSILISKFVLIRKKRKELRLRNI